MERSWLLEENRRIKGKSGVKIHAYEIKEAEGRSALD
jgi:hypothetical protein